MLRVLAVIPAIALCASAAADAYRAPDARDAGAARAASRDAIGQVDALVRNPHQLRALTGVVPPSAASPDANPIFIDPSDALRQKTRIDVQRLLEQHTEAAAMPGPDAAESAVLVFVSFSMPKPSLQALLDDSARTGAPLVLRGMVDGSMKRTLQRIRDLVSDVTPQGPQPTLTLDPTAYERFQVKHVPSFIFALEPIRPCARVTCPTPRHLKVSGDVRLAYALETMARQARDPADRAQVKDWLAREGTHP